MSFDIVIFKEPKNNRKDSDPYFLHLRDANFERIHFFPLFETRLINVDHVKEVFSTQAKHYSGGLIITSQRAVACLNEANVDLTDWTPIYTVGPATSKALREAFPDVKVKGEDCGNGESLVQFILDSYSASNKGSISFLYLVGDKTRSVIPDLLQKNGHNVDRLQVYATEPRHDLASSLASIQDTIDISQAICVFFSPSSCFLLKDAGLIPAMTISIGPTTSAAIRDIGWTLIGEAKKPTPESIAYEIQQYLKNSK